MASLCRTLEQIGKEGTAEAAKPLMQRLDEHYVAVRAALQARLGQDRATAVVLAERHTSRSKKVA